jgi:hypothetical protein
LIGKKQISLKKRKEPLRTQGSPNKNKTHKRNPTTTKQQKKNVTIFSYEFAKKIQLKNMVKEHTG